MLGSTYLITLVMAPNALQWCSRTMHQDSKEFPKAIPKSPFVKYPSQTFATHGNTSQNIPKTPQHVVTNADSIIV